MSTFCGFLYRGTTRWSIIGWRIRVICAICGCKNKLIYVISCVPLVASVTLRDAERCGFCVTNIPVPPPTSVR